MNLYEIAAAVIAALAAIALVHHFGLAALEAKIKSMFASAPAAQPVDHAAVIGAALQGAASIVAATASPAPVLIAPAPAAVPAAALPAPAASVPLNVAPRADGFALARGGAPLVNTVTKDQTIGPFTFNVPQGATGAKISVAGSPGGGWFHSVTYAVNGPSGTVIPQTKQPFSGTDGTVLDLPLAPGDYSMPLSVDGPPSGRQNLAVQYYP